MLTTLKIYFDELRIRLQVIQRTQQEIDRRFSPDFNLFNLFYLDENRLSYFIKILLDDKAKHGQQALFRELLFNMIAKKVSDNIKHIFNELVLDKGVKVDVEVSTTFGRRMDILIHNSKYAVMIENKPWAADQKNQIKDYVDYLRGRFDSNFYVIYLSGSAPEPSEESISKKELQKLTQDGHFTTLMYRPHLTEWARMCAEKSESEKMRSVFLDFEAYINSNFQEQYGE